jgi:hypothetical protein
MAPCIKWTRTICGLLLAFLVVGCYPESTVRVEEVSTERPVLTADEQSAGDLNVETFCSLTKIRTGVARLSWEVKPAVVGKQRIDVTVFKQGFEKGLYGTISPIEPDVELLAPELKEPDLNALVPVLSLTPVEMTYDEERAEISVDVEGLEPGLIYSWRVVTLTDEGWVPGNIASVEAPVCVADMMDSR